MTPSGREWLADTKLIDNLRADCRERSGRPQIGHAIWVMRRAMNGFQPNGYISAIDWDGPEVICNFYDGGYDSFDFDDLQYTERFGGQYIVFDDADEIHDRVKEIEEALGHPIWEGLEFMKYKPYGM